MNFIKHATFVYLTILLATNAIAMQPVLCQTAEKNARKIERILEATLKRILLRAIDKNEVLNIISIATHCSVSTLDAGLIHAAMTLNEDMTHVMAQLRKSPINAIPVLAQSPVGERLARVILSATTYPQDQIDKTLVKLCEILPQINDMGCITAVAECETSDWGRSYALEVLAPLTDAAGTPYSCPEEKIHAAVSIILKKPARLESIRRLYISASLHGLTTITDLLKKVQPQ